MIELRHLQNFIAVFDAGGVRQAAPVVHSSPSAISRSLRRLEEHFGGRLFERSGRRMAPTRRGEILREEARKLLSEFESLRPRVADLEEVASGALRVGVNPNVADAFLPGVAVRFLREYPEVEISTVVQDASGLVDAVLAAELDIIVGYERIFALQKELETVRLFEATLPWWARNEHPLHRQETVTMADFARYPIISQNLPSLYRERFFDLCILADKAHGTRSVIHAHQCEDYSVLRQIAMNSDAIFLCPEVNIMAGGFQDRLRRLSVPLQMPNAVICAALPARPSPLASQFLRILREDVAATLAALNL